MDESDPSGSGDRQRVVRRPQSPSAAGPRQAATVSQHEPSNHVVDSALRVGEGTADVASLGVGFIMNLQRTVGNAAVARQLGQRRVQAGLVIFRYLDDFPADNESETARREIFLGYIKNAVTAGVPAATAERAALTVLNHYSGWTHPAVGDFDWGYVKGPRGFKTVLGTALADVEEGPRKALLDAIFSQAPQDAVLKELGEAAGFVGGVAEEVEVNLDAANEPAFVDWAADWFETKGQWKNQGAVFRRIWETATPEHKNRILAVLLDRDPEHPTNVRLSDIDYLIESVTGFTPSSHYAVIMDWFNTAKSQDLFDYILGTGKPGYKTKYMTAEEREDYRLEISGNTIYTANTFEPLKGSSIFVLAESGAFYGGEKKSGRGDATTGPEGAIHHSSFMAGAPVHGAGHFETTGSGGLTGVNDRSGHYAPGAFDMGVVLYTMAENHATDFTGVRLTIAGKVYDAGEYLEDWKTSYVGS